MYKRNNAWVSDFWYDGQRYRKSWGTISKTLAMEKERRYRNEVAGGKHRIRARRIRFEKFAAKYLEYARTHKKPSSAKRDESAINMMAPFFRNRLLSDINPFMVERYKRQRREEGRAVSTVNNDLKALKGICKKAFEWGYLTQNFMTGVRLMPEDNEKMWVLTPEEEARLIEACEARPQHEKYLADLVRFALNSGMRLAEIRGLRKIDVHMAERFVLVRDTKNHENRRVPINDALKAVIEWRLAINPAAEFLFHRKGGHRLTLLTKSFWTAVAKAGLIRKETDAAGSLKTVRFRFHDLRHTFGSRIGMAGADLKTIMEIMGHKTSKMSMRYQHPTPEHKLAAVQKLNEVPPNLPAGHLVAFKIA